MRAEIITQKRSRALRRNLSLPEGLLWVRLRDRRSGVVFRRQHAVGFYVLDFFCAKARLAVEVDGEIHSMGDRPLHDDRRDAWLKQQGIDVLRLPAAEVLQDVDATADLIWRTAVDRLPLAALRSPSPSGRGRN